MSERVAVAAYKRAKKKYPLGQGGRFRAVTKMLSARGAKNPAALAAYIGRKKYGSEWFARLSVAGRKRRGKKTP